MSLDRLTAPVDGSVALLGRLLGGGRGYLDSGEWHTDRVVDAAFEHRVHLLFLAELRARGALEGCPTSTRDALETAERHAALVEEVRVLELQRVMLTLDAAGVRPVVFKGTSVAYTHYPRPYQRPRDDVDLFIPKEHADLVRSTLQSLGYVQTNMISGDWVMPQLQYRREWPAGVEHVYDVHWRIAIPVVFGSLLSFDELNASATPVAELGELVRGPKPVHALFIACVHRVAHHNDSPQLIWLYDIHLLASRLTAEEWQELEELASTTRTCAVCRRGLTLATSVFGTPLPSAVVDRLGKARAEPSAALLGGRTRELDIQLANWRSLTAWSERRQLLAQHLFPSPSYVMAKYNVRNRVWLPALYVHRIVSGALRWLRERHNETQKVEGRR